jgi:hypothetical protein
MASLRATFSKSKIELDTDGLSAHQVRLIKKLNHVTQMPITTRYEDEFFESCAELIKTCASIIKQSDFAKKNKEIYSDQALEYATDLLEDIIAEKKVVKYDN